MNNIGKSLKTYNIALLLATIPMIIISILLLPINYNLAAFWAHIIVSSVWFILVFKHLQLHYGSLNSWIKKTKALKTKLTKVLFWVTLLVIVSGLISTFIMLKVGDSTSFGHLHGKFGLVLILLSIAHILKRKKWYKGRTNNTYYTPTIDLDKCIGCNICVKKCPYSVLELKDRKAVVKNPHLCIACKKCSILCKSNAITKS